MQPEKSERTLLGFPLAFAVCAFFALIPLWSARYPPMADLAQHVAQVSIWNHLDDPTFGFSGQYELRWFQPYLGFYVLLFLLSLFAPLVLACKVLLSLYVVGLPLSILFMLRAAGRDPWRSLLGFPLAYGFSYYYGFAPFLIGIPLVFVFIGQVQRYVQAPTFARGVQLAGLGLLLWLCHLIALAIALASGCPLLLLLLPDRRAFFKSLLSVLPALLLGVAYMAYRTTLSQETHADTDTRWVLSWQRIWALPFNALGLPGMWFTVAGVGLLLAVGLGLRRPERNWRYGVLCLPAALALGCYLLFPICLMGVWHMFQRFAVFILPLLCLLTVEKEQGVRAWLARGILVSVTVASMLLVLPQIWAYDEDARDFDLVREAMEPGNSTMNLVFVPECRKDGLPFYPFFHHLAAWNQVEKGGRFCFSFAEWGMPLQLKPEWSSKVKDDLAVRPELFRWPLHGFADYYIVRSPKSLSVALFGEAKGVVRLRAQKGWWWLYERMPALESPPTPNSK